MQPRPFPGETARYRAARDRLLAAEVALRDQLEAVAALRRELPLGGALKEDYAFEELSPTGAVRRVRLSELFEPGRQSLLVYSFMLGPGMSAPCPMCTSLLDGLDGNAQHIGQRMSLAVVGRSPIQRLVEAGRARGWRNLRLVSAAGCDYQRDYHGEDEQGGQWPMANVFVKRDGAVHHFWGSELLWVDFPTGNQRHVDLLWPLWNVLDLTPEGRGADWYPALAYQ